MAQEERAICDLLDDFTRALYAKDATRAISPLADDAVTFDLDPPLQHGPEMVHDPARLEKWFATWEGPIVSEPVERTVAVDGDVAYAYGLQRMTGTKTDGTKVELFFRATACFRRDNGRWRITHMHNSVPFAMDGSDKALLDLKPNEHRTLKPKDQAMPKNTICLWYDKDAETAARFYAATFPDSAVGAVHYAPSDYPGGKEGDALTVEFSVLGIPCLGLNGGPVFQHNEAFSFQIATEDQEETDRYWNAIVDNGGKESQCGWCKDKWGISWQITPRVLTDALAAGGDEAKRAFDAMMGMKKIDIAAIEAARQG